MEREIYEEKFFNVKNEILDEIRGIVPEGSVHYFNEKFFVHFVDGEVATTEICAAVEVDHSEMVIFHTRPEGCDTTEMINGQNVLNFDENSFLDILDHLKKESKRKFVVRVSGSYSRCFEIEACTYEEALAEAKEDWLINPLIWSDANGEDWDDFTSANL